jgi:DNA polymerase-3 subunit delta
VADQAARAYLFWGEDTLSRDETVRSLRTRMLARPGGELNLSEFEAPEINARNLIDACNTVPFITDRRLVIVHQLFSWRPRVAARRRGEPGGEAKADAANPLKVQREAFLTYLPDLAPQTTLVLVEATLSPAQRTDIVKHLPGERAYVRAFPAPQGSELERWLARRARQRAGELGPGVAGLLREHGPASLEALDQEVVKLVTYAGREPVSTADLNELLPGAEMIVFDLLDAVAEGRPAGALGAFRRLVQQGQRPEELAPQLIALYRRLLLCRLALTERLEPAEVERTHGLKLIEKLKRQARGMSVEEIESALDRLLIFDRSLKLGEIEPESGMELLVADLAGAARAAGPAGGKGSAAASRASS